MNRLAVDVKTNDVKRLVGRLKRLKSVIAVRDGGAYWSAPFYSQVWVDTEMSEADLDDWLYRVNHGCEYVGVFERRKGDDV